MKRRITYAGVVCGLALAGCGTEPDRQETTEPPDTMTAVVVATHHDPEALQYTGGGPMRGTWDLEVCLADDDGQARPGRCGRAPVTESEWNGHELGDQIEVTADIPLTDEASQEEA